MYSNCCCSCSFEPEIIKVGQSSHKMYSNKILNFQESMTILNARTKSLVTYLMHHVYIYICVCVCVCVYKYEKTRYSEDDFMVELFINVKRVSFYIKPPLEYV